MSEMRPHQSFFTHTLLSWFAGHERHMPWKGVRDPYLIWLSEIMLQQTRVAQGAPYFERFRARFPTVQALAAATEDEVFKLWEGLGYYNRARNLHATAKRVAGEMQGLFPQTYEGLLDLKGVGPYTAAAIASFAYDLPYAVVDGNVYRVLSRFFGLAEPIDTPAGKSTFAALAQSALDAQRPGDYNQAIMDFGATVCVPGQPACHACPLKAHCRAFSEGTVSNLPVKSSRQQKRSRYLHFFVLHVGDQVLIRKRTGQDVWKGLYDFPYAEKDALLADQEAFSTMLYASEWMPPTRKASLLGLSKPYRQTLSHQQVHAVFGEVQLDEPPLFRPPDAMLVKREKLFNFAFPKIIDWYLNDKSLYLKSQ